MLTATAAHSPVKTSAVKDRRPVHFEKLDDIAADAEMLVAAKQVRAVGNWTLGQALGHLAIGMNGTIDGMPFKPPFWLRILARLMKKQFLKGPMPPGFRLPKDGEAKMVPAADLPPAEGLRQLKAAVARLKSDPHRAPSPVMGKLTREQSDRLQILHAELHLSFFWPVEG